MTRYTPNPIVQQSDNILVITYYVTSLKSFENI